MLTDEDRKEIRRIVREEITRATGSSSTSPHAVKESRIDNAGSLPESGFLRLPEILAAFPVGKTTWWEGVKSGRYPKGVKLSERITAWRVEDIRDLTMATKVTGA